MSDSESEGDQPGFNLLHDAKETLPEITVDTYQFPKAKTAAAKTSDHGEQIPPSEAVEGAAKQIEDWFSEQNLSQDPHLLGLIGEGNGLVSFNEICSWRTIRDLSRDKPSIRQALENSTLIEVIGTAKKGKIRRKFPLQTTPTVTPKVNQDGRGKGAKSAPAGKQHLSKNMLKPTGFEDDGSDTEVKLTDREQDDLDYPPDEAFTQRIQTAITRFRSRRTWHQSYHQVFDKFLIFGGFRGGQGQFIGGYDGKNEEDCTTREKSERTQRYDICDSVLDGLDGVDQKTEDTDEKTKATNEHTEATGEQTQATGEQARGTPKQTKATNERAKATDEHVEGADEHAEGVEAKTEGTEEKTEGTGERTEDMDERTEDTKDKVETTKKAKPRWFVDFEGIAKAFFSSQFTAYFAWYDEEQVKLATSVLRSFYRYLLLHKVCPEYDSEVEAAITVCDLAEKELPKLAMVDKHLPGGFNVACSMIFDGHHSDQLAQGDWAQGMEGGSWNAEEAWTVIKTSVYAYGTKEEIAAIEDDDNDKKKFGPFNEMQSGFEIVAIEMPSENAQKIYDLAGAKNDIIKPMGKLRCKQWKVPNDPPMDLPPHVLEQRNRIDPDRIFTFLLEASALEFYYPGCKFVATIKYAAPGIMWVDYHEGTYASFFTWTANEVIRGWKEPGPPTAWMERQNAKREQGAGMELERVPDDDELD